MSFLLENNKHIVVTYHYVEDPHVDRGGIHPCSIKEFDRQINYLFHNFKIESIEEVFEAAKNKNSENVCAITFDDGLKDQYNNAVPVLKKYNIPATFFIITSTIEGNIPTTHKIHTILSYASGEQLREDGNSFLAEYYPDVKEKYNIPMDKRLTDKRAYFDDIPTANFKEIVTILPKDIKKHLLSFLFKKHDIAEDTISNNLFMDESEIKDLHAQGFYIGSHTHSHEALDTLNEEETKHTILKSKEYLSNILGFEPTLFCYPHGSSSSQGHEILKEEGFTHSVTIEERAVNDSDNPLMIPRYDSVRISTFLNK